ncbi:hypothetical protein J1605_023016 [Eschrichtius robustus]|uniref:Uncharacterized protein n=1 Tax=Eschrichtius robustus TaxID=9764 RepID=A0AB34H767_ESCRO|nr:hypothetical protein J1605_023016 [Eschrichtius robustus]
MTKHMQQDLVLEEQRHNQASQEQEALLGHLICQLVYLLYSHRYVKVELAHPDSEITDVNIHPFQLMCRRWSKPHSRLCLRATHNKEVGSAVSASGCLCSVSGITQHKLCWLLQDREQIDKVYPPANPHRYIINKLKALKIPFLNCGSGPYIWVNLENFLDLCAFEEDLLLQCCFLNNKLILSRGETYKYKKPGIFHLVMVDKLIGLKHISRISSIRC